MSKEIWLVYHAGAYDWDRPQGYTNGENLVNQFKKDWGLEDDFTYEEMMSHDWQEENETKIEKITVIDNG